MSADYSCTLLGSIDQFMRGRAGRLPLISPYTYRNGYRVGAMKKTWHFAAWQLVHVQEVGPSLLEPHPAHRGHWSPATRLRSSQGGVVEVPWQMGHGDLDRVLGGADERDWWTSINLICWCLWRHHNRVVFEGRRPSVEGVTQMVEVEAEEWKDRMGTLGGVNRCYSKF